jgi:hypothetical protein
LQQLHPQQAVVLDPDAKAWHAAARQNGSRCPSAQMQDVCGKVAKKNAGSMTSERSLSRCGQTSFLIVRTIEFNAEVVRSQCKLGCLPSDLVTAITASESSLALNYRVLGPVQDRLSGL